MSKGQSGSPSTSTCSTRVQDLHSVPYDAGLAVAEMANRGVCDRGDVVISRDFVLGGVASVESMIGCTETVI